MNYIDRPLRPLWQAIRDTMPGVTGARSQFVDWSGDTGERAVDVALVVNWHADARSTPSTVEFHCYRNGRHCLPSAIMSHCDHLDGFFEDYGSGPVAHYCPNSVFEALRVECLKYLDRGAA